MTIMIIGHERIISYFDKTIKENRLSHAYGFIGPEQVGKKAIAFDFAAKILGTKIDQLSFNPDFIHLERKEDEKTGKLKKVITIEQARDLKSKLQNSVWGNGNRVVVIDGAEMLNEESGNALLKLLEEPPQKTVFFLIIKDESSLLTTVKSRLQIFYFNLVSTKLIANKLRELGVSSEKADQVSRRSVGKPGKAIDLLIEEKKNDYEELLALFQKMIGVPFYSKLKMIEGLYGDKEDGERGRTAWQEILNNWIIWFRDWLVKKHGGSQFASEPALTSSVKFSDREILNIIDSFSKVKKYLKDGVNPRLAIEEALLKIK